MTATPVNPRERRPPKPIRERRPGTQEKYRAILRILVNTDKRLATVQIADRARMPSGTVSTYLGHLLYEHMVDHKHGRKETGDGRFRLYGITDEGRKYLVEADPKTRPAGTVGHNKRRTQ